MIPLWTPPKTWSQSLYEHHRRQYYSLNTSSSWPAPLDYSECSLEELRTFLISRTTFPAWSIAVYTKSQLTSHLRQLDEKATFTRFMELAPELRVRVFEHLLRIDAREPVRVKNNYTAILRVSKLMNSEAHQVLYNVNDFRLRVGMYPMWEGFEIDASESRRYRLCSQVRTILSTPTTRTLSFQVHLMRELKSLTVHVFNDIDPCTGPLPFHCLMLSGAKRLTHVHVILHDHFLRLPKERRALILQPLTLLGSSTVLNIHGASRKCYLAPKSAGKTAGPPEHEQSFGSQVSR